MAHNHEEIAAMMEKLGCTGDHITASGIKELIEEIEFKTIELAGAKFMYCGIRMKGGFVVTGKPSACMDPDNWREAIGEKVSFDNAFSEIWRLEAYRKMSTELTMPVTPPGFSAVGTPDGDIFVVKSKQFTNIVHDLDSFCYKATVAGIQYDITDSQSRSDMYKLVGTTLEPYYI